jgi:hypothetical protein
MPTRPHPPIPFVVAASLVAALALAPARAAELPPKDAPAYTGVYRMSTKSKVEPTDDWTFTTDDTVTIAVLNKQSRWDYQSDGHTLIYDSVGRSSTVFGGKTPPNTANRSLAPTPPIGWEFGFATVQAATPAAPEVVGTDTVAGKECTRIRFVSLQYGKPEFCVTPTGIVLRFTNASTTAEGVYEATSITETPPDPGRFSTPPGYKVQDWAQPRKHVNIR